MKPTYAIHPGVSPERRLRTSEGGAMLTRRTFFASVAALAVGARVAPAIELPPVVPPQYGWRPSPVNPLWYIYVVDVEPRRDDGDTILELR